MKTQMRLIAALGLALCLGLLTENSARSADWGDSLTITLTPTGERGVMISTTEIVLSELALGTTKYTEGDQGVVVISTGSIAPIEYTIQGSISGGWDLSTDGYANSQDTVAVHALFKATAPTPADFATGGILQNLLGAVADVGDGAPGKYELIGADSQQMSAMPLNAPRNLWFQIALPPSSSLVAGQTITVTVTAEAP